ncbi:MAG TPA: amidase [Thermoanaerobaculia bacterium]|nr:amidase [Thermoanaerobaculia bacterium]
MSNDRIPETPESEAATNDTPGGVDRRTFLRLGGLATAASAAGIAGIAGATVAGKELLSASPARAADPGPSELNEATIAQMQAMMTARHLRSIDLVDFYQERIHDVDKRGPRVNSVLELNPDARAIAMALDTERRTKGPRGPLHGIPVMLKGNVDTADKMQTSAGSLALVGAPASQDATVAARLRAAGAVILGKTNLSEFANFRGNQSSSGWSGVGGQTNNPYALDHNPCGSSSGSGASVSANFCAAGLGTETDGSIVCPAHINGVVGIKPTLGLTSRAGVIPISHNQDVVGPHGRTVADAAAVLSALVGVDSRDPATAASAGKFSTDYTQFVNPDGLRGARIGIPRLTFTGYSPEADALLEEVIAAMAAAGAVIVDPADLPSANDLFTGTDEFNVLLYDFKIDLNAYLATRHGLPAKTLADIIAFNNAHANQELQFFGQELLEICQSDPVSLADYTASLAKSKMLARDQGIDAVMDANNLDALMALTGGPSWPTDLINGDHFLGASSTPAAVAGYPNVNVPAGSVYSLPIGVSFFGRIWSEPKLIKIASGFEHTIHARRAPQFLPSTPLDSRGRTIPRRAFTGDVSSFQRPSRGRSFLL